MSQVHQTPKLAQLTQPARPACAQACLGHAHGRAPPRRAARACCSPRACAACPHAYRAHLRACSLRTPRAIARASRQRPAPARSVPCAPSACSPPPAPSACPAPLPAHLPYAQWTVAHFRFCIYKFFFSLYIYSLFLFSFNSGHFIQNPLKTSCSHIYQIKFIKSLFHYPINQ